MHREHKFLTADSDIALYAFIRWKTTHGMRRWLLPKPEELPADSHPPASQTASVSRTLTLTRAHHPISLQIKTKSGTNRSERKKDMCGYGHMESAIQRQTFCYFQFFLVPCDIDAWTRNASYMMHSRQSCNDSIITQLHNLVRVRNVCTVPQLAVLLSLIFLVGHSGTVQLYA